MGSEDNRIHELEQFLRHLHGLKFKAENKSNALTNTERVLLRINKFGAWVTGSYIDRYGLYATEVQQFNIELDDEDLVSLHDKYSRILERKIEEQRLKTLRSKEQELERIKKDIEKIKKQG